MSDARPLVLQLITELNPGGAEFLSGELARRVSGFQMEIAALDGRGKLAEIFRSRGIPVHDLGIYRKFTALGGLLRLRRLLRRRRPAVLHTHLFHANIAGRIVAAGLGIPVISTCHIREARPLPWHFWLDRWTARGALAEVCVAPETAAFQQRHTGLPAEFFPVINNGIDLTVFRPAENEHERAMSRQALLPAGRKAPAVVCGFLGRLERQKGVDTLITAWLRLPQELRQMSCLLIAGEGRESAALRAQAADAPEVIFLGHHSRPAEFLRALDICALPSRYEGFGLAAAEALACGTAVIASTELRGIITDGANGALIPPDNPVLLANALHQLLANPAWRLRLATAGTARAADFPVEKMVEAYQALYRRALA